MTYQIVNKSDCTHKARELPLGMIRVSNIEACDCRIQDLIISLGNRTFDLFFILSS